MGGGDKLTGPDLEAGIAWDDLRDGTPLVGHAQGEAVLLVRRGAGGFAPRAARPRYRGPLGGGAAGGGTGRGSPPPARPGPPPPAPGHAVTLESGRPLAYGALPPAPGAEPRRLAAPGADRPHVHVLRTLAQSRAIIEGASRTRRAVIVGASFIGLEAAAALRARGLEVDVGGPEPVPLARVLGEDIGRAVRHIHEEHGVRFHLGQTVRAIRDDAGELPA